MTDPGMIEEGAPEHVELNSISSTSVSLANLDGVKGPFSGAPLPYKLPCTADKDRTCQIVRHLSTWNEFLFQVRMEIREVAGARGQLAVLSFDCPELPDAGDAYLHRIATLLHWLLSTHHCVRSFSASPTKFKSYKWLFRDALLKSSSVEFLKLQFARFHVCKDVCKIVAAAHHVKELELQSDGLSSAGVASALSTLLKATNTLVVLKIPHVSLSGPDADLFLTSLAQNKTLRELSVHESAFSEASVAGRTRFADRLKSKDALTALAVGKGNEVWYQYSFVPTTLSVRWILHCLLANSTVSSLKLTDSFDLLDSKVFSEVSVLSFGDFTNVVRLLRELPSYPHITSARLDIWTGDTTLSCAFADYIESSSTLRKLRLWLGSDGSREDANGWRTSIFASLSRNNSIRELHVTSMHMDEQDVYLLADSITSSRSIEKVHFGTVTLAESGALVRLLSLSIATNYTLLNVSLDSPVDKEAARHLFIVCDAARRNSDFVALAAQFVTGARRERQVSCALKPWNVYRVMPHCLLLSELTSMSTAEAAATVRSSLRSIEGMQEFMRLAGVVNEGITCSARGDACMHLADLNEHCWSHLRRYIKLYDVVYDYRGPHEPQAQ
ncbi:hypothetical protein HPB52_018119 [Rhipicephalus sanguineus]|uniref:Nlr family card domain protein n=1 Tax=Rhipicephalus sanguineus TaxID=34632 RepID=A0A9D4Q4E7_RHISA|nr:hypothetical protein HPB52_018119 [Rhipicephalus sanguineus]